MEPLSILNKYNPQHATSPKEVGFGSEWVSKLPFVKVARMTPSGLKRSYAAVARRDRNSTFAWADQLEEVGDHAVEPMGVAVSNLHVAAALLR